VSLPSDHGIIELSKLLDAIDGKTIRVTASSDPEPSSDADFDRRVRQSLDRQHRRQVIAGS
jgi:hypothetical protein